jgi:hypothetical protein
MDYFGPSGLNYLPATPAEIGGFTGGTPAQVNDALNAGSFLLQHRDHGFEYGWGEPAYTSDNISGLTNTDLSFIFSINCLTGKYNGPECFAEKFHRYTYEGQPAGALGLIAASETSYSFVNDVYVWGVFDNMFPDFMPSYGTTPPSRGMLPAFGNAAGKYFLKYSSWPYNTESKEVTYNLFHDHGDAFTCLYSEVPQNLTIIHDQVQLAGLSTFTIQADEGSLIALSVNGEPIGIGTGTGTSIDIPIIPQNPPDFIDAIVTKANFYRYHARIQVIPPSGPYVVTDSYVVNDASGNNNTKLDYSETVSLDVNLKNLGNNDAENVTAKISSDDEYLTILIDSAQAGTIPSNQTVSLPGAFSIRAADNIPNGHNILIHMQATNGNAVWNSSFSIKAFAPILKYVDVTVSDSDGNNNGRLDPGETVSLIVSITNKGASNAYDVYGHVFSYDPLIQVESDSAMFGEIPQNATVTQTFRVSAAVITPPGHQSDFTLDFLGNSGIHTTGAFSLIVGLFPVLVLDLDGNTNSGNMIKSAIDNWRVFSEYSQVIPADLSQYNTIFLCLGTYNTNHILTSDEASPFIDFLNNGGNLYMEGGDTWYFDQIYDPTSLHPMFNIDGLSDGTSDLVAVSGITGTMTEGLNYSFNGDNNFIDHIAPIDPAYNIFSNTTPDYNVTVANDAGTYKTIGSSFEFGGLMDNLTSTRKKLMLKYLNFFGMNPISGIPETPVGDTVVCENISSGIYSSGPVPNASYYIWELNPPGAGTVDGWGTEVTVNWTPGYAGDATLRVCGMNPSGLGPLSTSLLIRRYALPTAEISFSNTTICQGDTTFVTIHFTGHFPWHLVLSLGGYPVPMDFNRPDVNGLPLSPTEGIEVEIISVTDGTGCVQTGFTPTMINVRPLPATAAKPTGPENVDLFATMQSAYNTTGSDSSNFYEWSLDPPEAGVLTAGETGLDCTVDWDTAFFGQANLKVRGINDCGEGEYSDPIAVNVSNSFGIDENESGLGIIVYPNPNNGNFHVQLTADKLTKAKLILLSAEGEPVWGPAGVEINHRLILPLNLSTLSEGIYLLQVETNLGNTNRKILLNK